MLANLKLTNHRSLFAAILVAMLVVPINARSEPNAHANLSAPSATEQAQPDTLRHPVVYDTTDIDDMIGQMIMVGFHGTTSKAAQVQKIHDLIKTGMIGGVIIMARNVSNKTQLAELTAYLRSARPELPPFIAIDQEGGAVQRLNKRRGFANTPGAASIARKKSAIEARGIYSDMAKSMSDAGLNMNFGPVLDLSINKRNPIISRRGRAYGQDPEVVATYAAAFVEAHRENHILTVAKHFPGHGSSWRDSHHKFVDLSKTWNPVELEPYRRLAGSKAPDLVMVGHLYHPSFGGKDKLPASLSNIAIEKMLRGELNYKGLVVTDDLEMNSVRRRYKRDDLTIKAVSAGNDIILFSDATRPDHTPERLHDHIKNAIAGGKLTRKRISRSYQRILALKRNVLMRERPKPVDTANLLPIRRPALAP